MERGGAKRHRRQGRSCQFCSATVGEDDRRLSQDRRSWDYACRACLDRRPQLKSSEKQGVGAMSVGAGEQEGGEQEGGEREGEGATSPATAPLPTKRPCRRAPKGKPPPEEETEEEVSAPLSEERERVAQAIKQEGLTQKQVQRLRQPCRSARLCLSLSPHGLLHPHPPPPSHLPPLFFFSPLYSPPSPSRLIPSTCRRPRSADSPTRRASGNDKRGTCEYKLDQVVFLVPYV